VGFDIGYFHGKPPFSMKLFYPIMQKPQVKHLRL